MIVSVSQPSAIERKSAAPKVKGYSGEVVYIYAFDVAYDMTRQPIRELLGQPVAQFVVDAVALAGQPQHPPRTLDERAQWLTDLFTRLEKQRP